MYTIPFQSIDWSKVEKTEHKGETGIAYQQTIIFDGLSLRIVEYSSGYLADHWCQKGHIVYCLEGEIVNENNNGHQITMTPGSTYVVSNGLSTHRARSSRGGRLLIIDGDFLQPPSASK